MPADIVKPPVTTFRGGQVPSLGADLIAVDFPSDILWDDGTQILWDDNSVIQWDGTQFLNPEVDFSFSKPRMVFTGDAE